MAIARKKQASGSATESGGPGPGGNWIDKIEQVGDLGKGYMLLKLTTPRKGATYSSGPHALAETGAATTMPPSVKRFTPGQLEKLITSFSADLGIAPTVGVVRASPPAPKGNRTPGENDQFMYDLRAQEVANRTRDFDEGLLLTSTVLAVRLQMTTQALGKAVQSKRMFTLDGPSGRKVYPAFFADPRCNREHIERVCQALGDWPGPSKWEFFTSPRESLNGLTPIEALVRGELDQVLRAAAAFQER
ncbi:hypothetical protein PO883_08110 [Massilia sp. DJPM01]|nr:hypothetical protein [Massilia sp. DJPM01]MDM5177158.1 hypothetical protein [Massilia sp. DJPM01]